MTVTRGGYLKRTPIDTYERQTEAVKAASEWALARKTRSSTC